MKSITLTLAGLALAAIGAVSLTQCSGSSSSGAASDVSANDSGADVVDPIPICGDDDPCGPDLPEAGSPCYDIYGCSRDNFACPASFTCGAAQITAACVDGVWVLSPDVDNRSCSSDSGTDAGDGG
jgi:hypothetical protein